MLDAAKKARAFVGEMSREQFEGDEKTLFAVIRALEIVGEAARRIPADFQAQFPAIPWQRIIGMRNILAHNYDGTDPRIVYDTAMIFVPELLRKLPEAIAKADQTEFKD
jgi:uncharacterized protein with HEPN domain